MILYKSCHIRTFKPKLSCTGKFLKKQLKADKSAQNIPVRRTAQTKHNFEQPIAKSNERKVVRKSQKYENNYLTIMIEWH